MDTFGEIDYFIRNYDVDLNNIFKICEFMLNVLVDIIFMWEIYSYFFEFFIEMVLMVIND